MRPMDKSHTAAVRSFSMTLARNIQGVVTLSIVALTVVASIFLLNTPPSFSQTTYTTMDIYPTKVIEYHMGEDGVSEDWDNPDSALGLPDYNDFVALGRGGWIILEFSQPVINGPGYDFRVMEQGTPEGYMIYVSDDFGKTWTYINKCLGTYSYDLGSVKQFTWIKLIDYYSRTGYPYAGCDICGVTGFYAGTPTLEAKIEVDREIFNLNSTGQPVNAYIQLPLPYNPIEIDVSSINIRIDSQIDALNTVIIDQDVDGIDELAVPFNQQLTINVDGRTTTGAIFRGQKILENLQYNLGTCDKEIEENKALTEEVEALKAEIEGLKAENSSLQNDKEGLSLQVQNLTREKEGLNLQIQALTSENSDLKAQIQSLTIDAESCKGERVGLRARVEAALNEIETLRGQNNDLEEENKRLKEQYGNNGNGNDNGKGTGNEKGNSSGK